MLDARPDGKQKRAGASAWGLAGRCPRCRDGALFSGPFTLSLRSGCDRCGLDYKFIDAGDGPAIFAIFILGFFVLGGALIAEFKFGISGWAHVVLWGLLTPLGALVLLRALKSKLVHLQFRHGAGEGRVDQK